MKTISFWSNAALAAEQVRKRHPQGVEECLSLAGEICENRFTFRGHWEMERTHEPVHFPREIVWDETPNGDPEWVFAFSRHSFLVTLGKAWRLTGDARYGETAARLWADWIRRVPLTDASKKTTWRSIETGLRCESWLRSLLLLENCAVIPDELRGMIEESLRVHAQWLLQAHGAFQKLSNWGVLQDHGLFLLGCALGEQSWCDEAAARLDEQLRHQVLEDGSHWEQSPLYHCEVLHCCLDTVLAARRTSYRLPFSFLAATHSMARALARMVRPDGLLLCQSDSDEVDARDLLSLAALLFADPLLKGFSAGTLYEENLWDFADLAGEYESLAAEDVGGSFALRDSGNYMLWDGIGPDAGFLHFHCGPLGSGHGHADQLHVDLVSRGEVILTDSGRYTYVDCPIRKQLKRPSGHNTATVDGEDFTLYRNSWAYAPIAEPIKGAYRFADTVDLVEGAHLGYLRLGVYHRRRVLRLGGDLWLLWDMFHAADQAIAHRYDRFFHFGPDGSVSAGEDTVLYSGAKCSARVVLPGKQSLTLSRAPLSREYNRLEEGGLLCATTEASGDAGFAAVIATGLAANIPALSVELLPVSLAASGKTLSPAQAQALRIIAGSGEWTVILVHTEVISEVDLFTANGVMGYGKVIVAGPEMDGVTLAW